jgi:Hydrazine synthase alpha subunit middle domain
MEIASLSSLSRRCILLCLLASMASNVVAANPLAYLFTAAPRYEPDAWMYSRERFPSGAVVYLVSGSDRRRIAPDFAFAADPSVSYDGSRALFSGKRTPTGSLQIWESPISGGPPRQVTKCGGDCIRPLYLPDGRIVYTRMLNRESVLEVAGFDAGEPRRLTFAPGLYLTDDVLKDGRILFEVALRENERTMRELYTVYPDGTGIESLRCDHGHDRSESRQLSSGDVILQSDRRLARIRSGFTSETGLPLSEAGVLGPVAEVAPDKWILSIRDPSERRYSLYLWERPRKRLLRLETPRGANAVQPAIAAARTPPRDFPSSLQKSRHAANVLGVETARSIEPQNGVSRWVKVYAQDQQGTSEALGRAPLAPDGSFYLQVPGDRPLRFELLDAEGRTLRSERNWIWLRNGEQRICVGCHAGPEAAPENRLPDVLRAKPVPVVFRGVQ